MTHGETATVPQSSAPALPPQVAPFTVGGVLAVAAFGADPTGVTDSTSALQRAIDAAWANATHSGRNITNPGGPDLGGLAIDLGGGHYVVSAPLTLPAAAGGNVVFRNGALHASSSFPADRFMLEVALPGPMASQRDVRYRFLTFENVEFDAARVAAGCVSMSNFESVRFVLCLFSGFTRRGLWAHGVGNELYVDSCWFRELGGETNAWQCHNGTAKTGTALWLDNNDHSIANTVVYCAKQGIVVNGSATVVRNAHVYTEGPYSHPNGCAYVPSGVRYIRFVGCYFDGCPVYADDPAEFDIADSLFLFSSQQGPCCYNPVVLTPTWTGAPLDGVRVTGNVAGGGAVGFDFVVLNETRPSATFDHDTAHGVVVSNNGVTRELESRGVRPTSTRATATVVHAATPTTTWVANLTGALLLAPSSLGNVQYSLEVTGPPSAIFTRHALVSAGRDDANVVVVRTEEAVTGTLRVSVDQSSED